MNDNNRLSLLKKDSTVPRALLFVHLPGVGFLLLLVLAAPPLHLVQCTMIISMIALMIATTIALMIVGTRVCNTCASRGADITWH